MKPEEVFVGMTTTEWATVLCRCLIMRKDWVRRTLKGKTTYGQFCEKITWWNDKYVINGDESYEHTAKALYVICEQFGLIELMRSKGLIGQPPAPQPEARPRGVRTRGATRGSIKSLEQQLVQVARLFGQAE